MAVFHLGAPVTVSWFHAGSLARLTRTRKGNSAIINVIYFCNEKGLYLLRVHATH